MPGSSDRRGTAERAFPTRPWGKVDKSALPLGPGKRVRDPAYRRSAEGRACDVPGCAATEGVVLAHISFDGNAGKSLKAPDDESLFLCADHHQDFDLSPDRAGWLVAHVVLPQRRSEYQRWKAEHVADGGER